MPAASLLASVTTASRHRGDCPTSHSGLHATKSPRAASSRPSHAKTWCMPGASVSVVIAEQRHWTAPRLGSWSISITLVRLVDPTYLVSGPITSLWCMPNRFFMTVPQGELRTRESNSGGACPTASKLATAGLALYPPSKAPLATCSRWLHLLLQLQMRQCQSQRLNTADA
jgi:hypothetical protein